jgi:hypothetical protein
LLGPCLQPAHSTGGITVPTTSFIPSTCHTPSQVFLKCNS